MNPHLAKSSAKPYHQRSMTPQLKLYFVTALDRNNNEKYINNMKNRAKIRKALRKIENYITLTKEETQTKNDIRDMIPSEKNWNLTLPIDYPVEFGDFPIEKIRETLEKQIQYEYRWRASAIFLHIGGIRYLCPEDKMPHKRLKYILRCLDIETNRVI